MQNGYPWVIDMSVNVTLRCPVHASKEMLFSYELKWCITAPNGDLTKVAFKWTDLCAKFLN